MLTPRERQLHDEIGFVGLRAHATAAAVLQICAELRTAGILGEAAITRIKGAVAREVALSHARGNYGEEFERALGRLDDLFSGQVNLAASAGPSAEGQESARAAVGREGA